MFVTTQFSEIKKTRLKHFSKHFSITDCWYFATSFNDDFDALGEQLTRYRSFIILSCFGNDRARAVRFITNTSPVCMVAVTGNILILFKTPRKTRKKKCDIPNG